MRMQVEASLGGEGLNADKFVFCCYPFGGAPVDVPLSAVALEVLSVGSTGFVRDRAVGGVTCFVILVAHCLLVCFCRPKVKECET